MKEEILGMYTNEADARELNLSTGYPIEKCIEALKLANGNITIATHLLKMKGFGDSNFEEKNNSYSQNQSMNSIKSIIIQVDDATKGIMQEIQSGITEDIVNVIFENRKMITDLYEKIDEIYNLEKKNNKLLDKILKNQKHID
jgi:translation elongation factor EF-Ts